MNVYVVTEKYENDRPDNNREMLEIPGKCKNRQYEGKLKCLSIALVGLRSRREAVARSSVKISC